MEGDITKKTRGYRTKSTAEDSRLEFRKEFVGIPQEDNSERNVGDRR